MKVLVAGANGHTGRLIIEKLALHPNHDGYAMIRDKSQAKELTDLGANNIVYGDLEKDITHVVKEMDAVIFAAGSGSKTGPDKTISVDQEGAKRLVEAAKKEGIRHFVMLSARGVDNPEGSAIEHYKKAKKIADDYLKESGLTYTIVRPGRLNFENGTGKADLRTKIKDHKGRSVSREDVAEVLVKSLDIKNVKNATFEMLDGEVEIEKAMKEL